MSLIWCCVIVMMRLLCFLVEFLVVCMFRCLVELGSVSLGVLFGLGL